MNDLYINLGTEKCCLFVSVSDLLISKLKEKPLLYYAVEEALECAKIGYFGIGIIAFAQLLILFNERVPEERHTVAHEFLSHRPTPAVLQTIIARFKTTASKRSNMEIGRARSKGDKEYRARTLKAWESLVADLRRVKR